MTTPSDTQLATIAGEIFILRDRSTTRLETRQHRPPSIHRRHESCRDRCTLDGRQHWPDRLHRVSANPPNVWLHNENEPYRIGSAAKIAMMLAAMQLRLVGDPNSINT